MKEQAQNNKIIIENQTKHNFIIVYDSIYKNKNLTIEEIGFLCKLIATAPKITISHRNILKCFNIGHTKALKITKSLQEKGYLKIETFGNSSKWTISQEPLINTKINDFSNENLINALINNVITLKDLKTLHKLKYIDDNQLSKIGEEYIKQVKKIIDTPWLKER